MTVGPNATGKNFTATCGTSGQVERLSNGGFETLTASTNSAPDGSWSRTAYTGTSFNTLIANGTRPTDRDGLRVRRASTTRPRRR